MFFYYSMPVHRSFKDKNKRFEWGQILNSFEDRVSKIVSDSVEEHIYVCHSSLARDLGISLDIVQHIFSYFIIKDSSYNQTMIKKSNYSNV